MKKILFFIFLCSISFLSFAEVIYLKNGRTIEAKIIERTDYFVKVDFQGIPLTYFLSEIDTITDEKPKVKSPEEINAQEENAYLAKVMEIALAARNICDSKMVIDGQEVNFAPKANAATWKALKGYYEGKKAILENLQREFQKITVVSPQFRKIHESLQKVLDYAVAAYEKAIESLEKDDITILDKDAVSLLNQSVDLVLNIVHSLKKLKNPQS
ncbi:MAG: hypothetical protein Q8O30_11245 [Candidatus Omnitrophota bacterium]|nr:hypothetical protein [Candidatus Omnitrophota bacterium]